MNLSFKVKSTSGGARLGLLKTARTEIETPVFMPVGTVGSVKAVSYAEMKRIPTKILLANTYHLYLRPGMDIIREAGGLHKFIGYDGSILTDSGGFQVFSLGKLRKLDDTGYHFQSHIDGSRHIFTPEKVVEIQTTLGSDILMQLDECIPYTTDKKLIEKSVNRTLRWAEISKLKAEKLSTPGSLFPIVQGSGSEDLRVSCAVEMKDMNFPGYAIGGLSVGEGKEEMRRMTEIVTDILPVDKPRYLMGVGAPEDLVESVARGVDMFDCVIPTRNARNATVYTFKGKLLLRNAQNRLDFAPIEEDCPCPACTDHTRAYISHLFKAKEINSLYLATIHNLNFFHRLMERIRDSIRSNQFSEFREMFSSIYPINGH